MIRSRSLARLDARLCIAGGAFATWAVLAAHSAVAEPLQVGVGLDERYSDNINLSADNPRADLEHQAVLTLKQQTDPGVCGSDLSASATYIHYQRNTYSDHTNLDGNWNGNCRITQSLLWNASDNISEQSINSNQPSTPNNQTRENIFSTGPQYFWHISNRDQLVTSAQAQQTTFSNRSRNNAKHYIGNANYTHQVSPNLSVGAGGSYNRGEINDGQTLTVRSAHLNFTKSFVSTTFSAQMGYSWLNDDYLGTNSQNSGLTWKLRLDRQLNLHGQWYAEYGRELTDTSSSYVYQVQGLAFNLAQTTAVRVSHWRTGYTQGFSNDGSLGLSLGQSRSDYVQQGYSQTASTASLSYSQPIVTNLSGSVTLTGDHNNDERSNLAYNRYGATLAVHYQRTRQLSLRFEIGRNQRAGGSGGSIVNNGLADNYQENWTRIGARYLFR